MATELQAPNNSLFRQNFLGNRLTRIAAAAKLTFVRLVRHRGYRPANFHEPGRQPMRTQVPRFLLGSSRGWKTFHASADCVVLPGFSSYDAAAGFCQADGTGVWELRPVSCDRVRERLQVACPQSLKLVAIEPADACELSLLAVTLEAVCDALRTGAGTIVAEHRLMRNHRCSLWDNAPLTVAGPRSAKAERWYVACLHPQNLRFAGGQPLWFWLDWFAGKHVFSELQTERGGNAERQFFVFDSRVAAEGFCGATVARLGGCIQQCQIDSPSGSEFEVTLWEKDREICHRTSAVIGQHDGAPSRRKYLSAKYSVICASCPYPCLSPRPPCTHGRGRGELFADNLNDNERKYP